MKLVTRTATTTAALSLMLIIGACGTQSARAPGHKAGFTTGTKSPGGRALSAREYLQLAERAEPPLRQRYMLQAVGALIKSGRVDEARNLLQRIEVEGLAPSYAVRKTLLAAHMALYEKQPARALDLLNRAERRPGLDPPVTAEIYWLRAQAELARDNPMRAADNLVRREQFIVAKKEIERNQQELWDILESSSPTALRNERYITYDPILRGWIDLALISIQYAANPHRRAEAINTWRRSYPGHPASTTLLFALTAPPQKRIEQARNIALLLPLTSQFEKASQAVYDGFMALHGANTDPARPSVIVYDIGGDPAAAPAYYQQAVREGAQLIVGPLGREAAETLARSRHFSVPTLLLSDISDGVQLPADAYQFGLPPEDEAKQVAERAYLEGHRLAAVLYPDTQWGARVGAAFQAHWENLGGIVVEAQRYQPADSDHSLPIKRLLNIDASEARKTLLEIAVKTKLEFEPRRREDVDFIFLAADAQQGRLLKPQINFYRALDLPVYSTSRIYSGKPDPIYDADLNGITFGGMPWMLITEGRIQALKETVQGDWPNKQTQLDRLYALGMDAYGIIPHLQRLSAHPFARYGGVTGGLTMDRAGRVHRQLVWARFAKGVPVLLDAFYGGEGQTGTGDETGTSATSNPRPGSRKDVL